MCRVYFSSGRWEGEVQICSSQILERGASREKHDCVHSRPGLWGGSENLTTSQTSSGRF